MPNTLGIPEKLAEDGSVAYPRMIVYRSVGGFKPCIYWWNPEGFPEPYETFRCGFNNLQDAKNAAITWSEFTGVQYVPAVHDEARKTG